MKIPTTVRSFGISKGNGASKGSFANSKKIVIRPISFPKTSGSTG